MPLIFFIIASGIAFGIFSFKYEESVSEGLIWGAAIMLIGCFISLLVIEDVNVDNIRDSLVVIASQSLDSGNLEDEILKTIKDEIDDRFFDVSIDIDFSNIDKLDVYKVDVKAKYRVLTKVVREKYKCSFKVFIDKSDVENFNKDSVEIIGI